MASSVQEEQKRRSALAAVEYVKSGMVIGLGSGSTAAYALMRLADLLKTGTLENVRGVPSSLETELLALRLGVPLVTLDRYPDLDLNIDGADEVDPQLNLIKGGGGALLREKVLAQASRRNIIVIDQSKLSPRIGSRWALPIEVVPFAAGSIEKYLELLGARVRVRQTAEGARFQTDQNNLIMDADFGPIKNPSGLARRFADRAGIAAHGLFLGLADIVIVAEENAVRYLERDS